MHCNGHRLIPSASAVWAGSESHPYAVKPTGAIVAEAIGATPGTQAVDWQFACKAGTEAMQAAIGFVGSGMAPYALAIGMDTAQGRPGDALEYTAGQAARPFCLARRTRPWPRAHPELRYRHQRLLGGGQVATFPRRRTLQRRSRRFRPCGPRWRRRCWRLWRRRRRVTIMWFSTSPTSSFPCGPCPAWVSKGAVGDWFAGGRDRNTYAGSAIVGLTAILDVAQPGQRVLAVSYGSGAGSDAFQLRITDRILEAQNMWPVHLGLHSPPCSG